MKRLLLVILKAIVWIAAFTKISRINVERKF